MYTVLIVIAFGKIDNIDIDNCETVLKLPENLDRKGTITSCLKWLKRAIVCLVM